MTLPITIIEVVGPAVQGMTRPFLCKAGFFDYYVKGAYAGLDSLCCEWGENIDPSPPVGYSGTRHRTSNIERRRKEKRSLAEAVGTRRGGLPPAMRDALCDLQKLVNARSAFRSARTMRGPWGSGLPRFIGFPWARRIGVRPSLREMHRQGGRIGNELNP